jgi:hypothetical protein
MIRDHLLPAVKEVFPNLAFKISPTSNPIISLSSSSAEIGDLHIYDDGDQATVYHYWDYRTEISVSMTKISTQKRRNKLLQKT